MLMLTRRSFAGSLLSAATLSMLPTTRSQAAPESRSVTLVVFDDAGRSLGARSVAKVMKSDAEWRALLPPASFEVARKAGTERPYSGVYNALHEKGLYRCICCGNALFSSSTKFESGTGWPSFWQPIARQNVSNHVDRSLLMARTEVTCTQCDAHLGHVFEDGPKPTGLRYCMNSVSLKFTKQA